MINTITILGGIGKNGLAEPIQRLDLKMGDILSIVGPTGSGKTTLIEDIELFANKNTPTQRQILINNQTAKEFVLTENSYYPIAFITQHTNFLSDLAVEKFLAAHASTRNNLNLNRSIHETIDFANQLTGEPIDLTSFMTELSGGQTRALLIADAVVIGNSPIILLDEIENAGINRIRALELLKNYQKIFIFVTHDPRITLLSDFRIVMKNGAMTKLIFTTKEEQNVLDEIVKVDNLLIEIRNLIRQGKELSKDLFSQKLKEMNYSI